MHTQDMHMIVLTHTCAYLCMYGEKLVINKQTNMNGNKIL